MEGKGREDRHLSPLARLDHPMHFSTVETKTLYSIFLLLVAGAVRRNKRTAAATDDEIKREAVRYLHGAADRGGGRTRRHNRVATEAQLNADV